MTRSGLSKSQDALSPGTNKTKHGNAKTPGSNCHSCHSFAFLLNAFGDFKAPNVDTRIKSFRRRSPIREDENLSRLFTTSGSHPGWLRPRKRHDDLCPLD